MREAQMAALKAAGMGATPAQAPPMPRNLALSFAAASVFTLIDLFGPQAIGPALSSFYGITPKLTGMALNVATVGMATGALLVAPLLARIGRKTVIVSVLLLLAVPTALLGTAPGLPVFVALRLMQGLLMGAGFATTIAFVGEEWGPIGQAAPLMAWYITGNVGANLFGRVTTGVIADAYGWRAGFLALGAANLIGGFLLSRLLPAASREKTVRPIPSGAAFARQLADKRIIAACGVGFLILFTFIGVFNYANYRLAGPSFGVSVRGIGLLYVVFAASLAATPLAGPVVAAFGHRRALMAGAIVCLLGSLLMLSTLLLAFMAGLALIGVGTFFCQAVATGFVSESAVGEKVAASGLYLATYYVGGMCGAVLMGLAFEQLPWSAFVMLVAAAFGLMLAVPALAWPRHAVPIREIGEIQMFGMRRVIRARGQ